MTRFLTRDPETGMRRNGIRWPRELGLIPEPSGCRWCGVSERAHVQRWTTAAGWHVWARPTQAQIKARMLARRRLAGRPIPVRSPVPCDEMTHDSVGNEVFCRLELGHEEDHDGGRVTWPRED